MSPLLTDGNATFGRRRSLLGRVAPWAAAALAVVTMGAIVVMGLPVTVDGRTVFVPPGMRLEHAVTSGRIVPPPGDVLSAKDGRVVRAGAGGGGRVVYRGVPLSEDSRILPFRAYGLQSGPDVVEPTRTVTETVAFDTTYRGEGAEERVLTLGRDGARRNTVGAVSGDVLESEWLVEPRPQVVERFSGGRWAKGTGTVRGSAKLVAITFDDGPDPSYTPRILGILKDYGVKATFFVLSSKAKRDPDLARRIVTEGHQIANHSRTHRDLTRLSAQDLEGEFRRSQEAIRVASGVEPRFFRAPYGITNTRVEAQAKRSRLTLVNWDIDSTDWTRPGTKVVVKRAVPKRDGGVIVLMHDSGGDRRQTVAALPAIIREYKARGYEFVTVDAFFK